jgi:hypothetical protein
VKDARTSYIDNQPNMSTAKLVFIDQTYARCDQPEYYGWSKTGSAPIIRGTRHGTKVSLVGAIAQDGERGNVV